MTLAIDGGPPVRREFLPFALPKIEAEAVDEVIQAIRSGWLTTGPRALKFEQEFARYCGAPHAVAVSSCTAALHLALLAAEVGPGDEVITSPFTFVATAEAIQYTGATPVFADVDPQYLNLDPVCVAKKITSRTKALLPVHYAGAPCAIDALQALAAEHDLPVIYDAAHAVETRYRGRHIAAYGEMNCFSFYATKNLPTGEGGMITTADAATAQLLRELRLHGMSQEAWQRYNRQEFRHYAIVRQGYKYNFTDVCAALGLHQLAALERNYAYRMTLIARYDAGLADLPAVRLHPVPPDCRSGRHLYPVRFDLARLTVDRDRVAAALQAEGIGVSVHFTALHLQPYYQQRFGCRAGDYPVAGRAALDILSLPLTVSLSERDIDDVLAAVHKVVAAYSR